MRVRVRVRVRDRDRDSVRARDRVSEQHTTQTSLGGRCLESRLLVRRRMNWLTIIPSSPDLRAPSWRSRSVASGSLVSG